MRDFFINQVFDGNLLIAIFVAVVAGLISFFSPCVIPLVPGYISYASGMSDTKSRSRVFSVHYYLFQASQFYIFLTAFYLVD